MPSAALLVLQPWADSPTGCLQRRARAHGIQLVSCRPYAGDPVPGDLADISGVLVLGGGIGAYSDALHPWLPDIKSLIAVAVVGRIPLLGVSLGHQLVAVALGGTVTLNPNGPCRGLLPLRVTDLARLDPLFRHLPDDAQVVHWNDDVVVDLPAGAVALAYAPDGGLSAVRYAATCWGVQGNPEATAEAIEAWALHPSVPGLSPDADLPGLLTTVRAAAERTSTTWRPLLDEFLAQVSRADGGPAESSEPPPTG